MKREEDRGTGENPSGSVMATPKKGEGSRGVNELSWTELCPAQLVLVTWRQSSGSAQARLKPEVPSSGSAQARRGGLGKRLARLAKSKYLEMTEVNESQPKYKLMKESSIQH